MSYFKEKRILVTGGAGFIGSHVVGRLMSEGASVCVLDDMSNGEISNIEKWRANSNFRLLKEDIRDGEAVRKALKDVDIVFHQAAKVSVPVSVREPQLVMDINVMGSTVVLDECRKADVDKIVVASSSSVYGDTPTLPKIETMPTSPISPYAVSKLAEETLTLAFSRTYGLDATALRYFNVYGPRQRGGAYAGVISIFISNAIESQPLLIDGDGLQTRDFTYIDDVVECNLLSASTTKSKGKVYNVGGGAQITIKNLAERIVQANNSTSSLSYGPERLGDVRDSLASIERARKDLGYRPRIEIDEGLMKTIEWVKSRKETNRQ